MMKVAINLLVLAVLLAIGRMAVFAASGPNVRPLTAIEASGAVGSQTPMIPYICDIFWKQAECNDANGIPKCSGSGARCHFCKVQGEAVTTVVWRCKLVTDGNQSCTPLASPNDKQDCGSPKKGTCVFKTGIGVPPSVPSSTGWFCEGTGSPDDGITCTASVGNVCM